MARAIECPACDGDCGNACCWKEVFSSNTQINSRILYRILTLRFTRVELADFLNRSYKGGGVYSEAVLNALRENLEFSKGKEAYVAERSSEVIQAIVQELLDVFQGLGEDEGLVENGMVEGLGGENGNMVDVGNGGVEGLGKNGNLGTGNGGVVEGLGDNGNMVDMSVAEGSVEGLGEYGNLGDVSVSEGSNDALNVVDEEAGDEEGRVNLEDDSDRIYGFLNDSEYEEEEEEEDVDAFGDHVHSVFDTPVQTVLAGFGNHTSTGSSGSSSDMDPKHRRCYERDKIRSLMFDVDTSSDSVGNGLDTPSATHFGETYADEDNSDDQLVYTINDDLGTSSGEVVYTGGGEGNQLNADEDDPDDQLIYDGSGTVVDTGGGEGNQVNADNADMDHVGTSSGEVVYTGGGEGNQVNVDEDDSDDDVGTSCVTVSFWL